MSKKLDALFVIPGDLKKVYQGLAKGHAIEPPSKARWVGAYLMRRNMEVDLIDANIKNGVTPEAMAEKVVEMKPRLIVLPVYGYNPSSSTHTMPSARAYARAIKDITDTPIIMMGTHPAALPEKTLLEEPIDFVCSGEGPITIYELILSLENGGDFSKVKSLWYRKDNIIAHNNPAPLIDLDKEPALLGWKLMDPHDYYAHEWHTFWRPYEERAPYANPFSIEGCPFSCDFCNIQAPFRDGESLVKGNANSYRRMSPRLFIEEITFLVENHGVKYFKVPDEMFGLHPKHVEEIARGVSERFGDQLNFWCYFRVDTCRDSFLEILRAAGFRWLGVGIEAADSTVRSGQDKSFTDDKIFDIIGQVRSHGIEIGANYIFGLPGETHDTMRATYEMAVALNTLFANLYCCQALPGAPLYKKAKLDGYPLPEREGGPGWIGHSQYSYESEPYVEMNTNLTPAEVLKFRDEAHVKYYTRPEYRKMILGDPKCGQVALDTIDAWVEDIRGLKRRIIEEK